MNTINKVLEGRKTYIGLIIALIGVLGIGQYITPFEGTELVNSIWNILGITIAIYGRMVARTPSVL